MTRPTMDQLRFLRDTAHTSDEELWAEIDALTQERDEAKIAAWYGFVAGVAWWEYRRTGGTLWSSCRNWAEEEAEKRYPYAPHPLVRTMEIRAEQAEAEALTIREATCAECDRSLAPDGDCHGCRADRLEATCAAMRGKAITVVSTLREQAARCEWYGGPPCGPDQKMHSDAHDYCHALFNAAHDIEAEFALAALDLAKDYTQARGCAPSPAGRAPEERVADEDLHGIIEDAEEARERGRE